MKIIGNKILYTYVKLLNSTLSAVQNRYELIMDEPFPVAPEHDFFEDNSFIALAQPVADGVRLHISTGVVDALTDLWQNAEVYSNNLPEEDQLNVGNIDQAIDTSLQWLMLHELHHYQMGHFKLNGGMGLAETSAAYSMGLTSRSKPEPCLIDQLPLEARPLARRCMELQADHDSTEMLLDVYSNDGWDILRFYAACIFAVMVLIEREEKAQIDDDEREYPKAATRIFQFMGYLTIMWSIPAVVKAHQNGWDAPRAEDLPSTQEIEAFHAQVIVPAFSDAILIAKANDAQSVIDDLGSVEDFIADVRLAQNPENASLSDFKTVGAKEYMSLAPVNAALLDLLEIDPFTA